MDDFPKFYWFYTWVIFTPLVLVIGSCIARILLREWLGCFSSKDSE